jgi:hypothetical protein
MKARPGATFEQMLADVRTQIGVCEFKNVTVDELARHKLITLISDNSLRKTLLKKADLKLDELIAEARSFFSARTHLAECDGTKEQVKVNEVRSAPRAGLSQSAKTCTRCGYSHAPRSCPAESKECHTCGGEDHFSQGCPNDTMSEAPRDSRPRGRSWRGRSRGRGRAARANNGKVHQTTYRQLALDPRLPSVHARCPARTLSIVRLRAAVNRLLVPFLRLLPIPMLRPACRSRTTCGRRTLLLTLLGTLVR